MYVKYTNSNMEIMPTMNIKKQLFSAVGRFCLEIYGK